MTSVLLYSEKAGDSSESLLSEFDQQGLRVVGVLDGLGGWITKVGHLAPEVVVLRVLTPSGALLKAAQALVDAVEVPVLLFAEHGDPDQAQLAVEAGLHAYVVGDCQPAQWPIWVRLAQARYRREKDWRQSVQELTQRLEERKSVERAKGILMQARQLSDEAAFQILRTLSMHANQRLGQVSEHIIHSAQSAAAVNRSGQLRMLSQRMVKLYLLQLAGVQLSQSKGLLHESMTRTDENLKLLKKIPATPATEQYLPAVLQAWTRLRPQLEGPPRADRMLDVNELAEHLLLSADHLTNALKTEGAVESLQVLNTAGRQRMLLQRFTKYAVLHLLGAHEPVPEFESLKLQAQESFEQGLRYLQGAPLSTPETRESLAMAELAWQQILNVVSNPSISGAGTVKDRMSRLASVSENLLDVFERLSVSYERSLDMLLG